MIEVRVASGRTPAVLALAVVPGKTVVPGKAVVPGVGEDSAADGFAVLASPLGDLPGLADEVTAFLRDVEHSGAAGTVHALPRPGRTPATVLLVGVGAGTGRDSEAAWRAAGAGLARAAASRWPSVQLRLAEGADVAALAEGALLASYRYSASAKPPPRLRRLTVEPLYDRAHPVVADQLARAGLLADAVAFARDLTNAPGLQKSPKWFADRVASAAGRRSGVTVKVLDEAELRAAGFGGILAVGGGSVRPPRLVELSWRPRGATQHVVLVGKGITFDTGGYSIKPVEGMRLMRKDMAGAAAVCATVLAAADLNLPVRVTALAPVAENMVSGSAFRPGDVVRHYGGRTSEVHSTDAEGRLVVADALAYAVKRLRPDVLIDLATLTGASHVALGKRIAALMSDDDELAEALSDAGAAAGEPMWRLPLADDYLGLLASDVADLNNAPSGGAGVITAGLYLREFVGELRAHWAHVDMSAPAWFEGQEGPLVKGATGWGVRMLTRYLGSLA